MTLPERAHHLLTESALSLFPAEPAQVTLATPGSDNANTWHRTSFLPCCIACYQDAVVDGSLVTGQQNYFAGLTADGVLKQLAVAV
jgi:hypothetical protein